VAACAVDGIIYAIGGVIGTISAGNMQALATVEACDPGTDQWTPKTRLPKAAAFHLANAVDGLIYVFSEKDTFAYDPKTDRWIRKAPIPTWSLNSLFATSSVVDGIVYLFGGSSNDGWTTYYLTLSYDPDQDKFTAKRKIPVTCEAAACATIDGKIYHSGGVNQDPVVSRRRCLLRQSVGVRSARRRDPADLRPDHRDPQQRSAGVARRSRAALRRPIHAELGHRRVAPAPVLHRHQ
jgi:N-acetylneuraminic acid mutarotase